MCTTHALVHEKRAAPPYPTVQRARCESAVKLEAHTATNNSGDLEEYGKARRALQRAVNTAKGQYRDRVESIHTGSKTCGLA